MSIFVLGIGLGVFLLISVWVLAILVCLVSLRINKKIAVIAISIAITTTVLLVIVPRATDKPNIYEEKLFDHLYIWRLIIVILLAISSITGLVGYFSFKLLEPVTPQKINSWVF